VPKQPEYPTDRVARELRARVESGEWAPGAQIPSVGDLADHHSASRTTISKAVQRLVDAGVLVVLPNYGTFVAEREHQD
jgi:DNA-binding GntR family transcriptional regulator